MFLFEHLKNNSKNTNSELRFKSIPFMSSNKNTINLINNLQVKQLLQLGVAEYSLLPKTITDTTSLKTVIIIYIEGYNDLSKNAECYEYKAIKSNIINTFENCMLKKRIKCINCDFGGQELAIALHSYYNYETQEIVEIATIAKQYITEHLKTDIAISISDSTTNYDNMNYLFQQCSKNIRFKYSLGANKIITTNDKVISEAIDDLIYPQNLEEELVQAIKTNQFSEADQIISNIIKKIRVLTPENVSFSVLKLCSSFCSSIEKNPLFSDIDLNSDSKKLFKDLLSFESIDKLSCELRTIVLKLDIAKDKNENNRFEKISNEIKSYILQNYKCPDINVFYISCKFNFSPEYIGKIFKIQNNISITQYLSDIRINKAIELIKERKNTIYEISERVGIFNVNYFYKIFKQKTGRTPRQYTE